MAPRFLFLALVSGLLWTRYFPAPRAVEIPAGRVLVELAEPTKPVETTIVWPEHTAVTETFTEDVFGLFELPQKYIATGMRADRAFPTVVRATAAVRLPAGKHRLLLRARGPARLWVDGRKILETPFAHPAAFAVGNAGELPVEPQETYLNLGPDFRFATPGNREEWGEFEFTGEPGTVVLEAMVGGFEPKSKKPFRPELGETVVAFSPAGTIAWWLLSPGSRVVPYTASGSAVYETERRTHLAAINAQARQARRAKSAAYWATRRAAADIWLASTPEIAVPALPVGFPAKNPIDHFIAERIAKVSAEYAPFKKGGVDFFRDVKPILETHCYSCHQGAKAKGGLRLDTLTAALKGGKADGPALVAGHPEDSPIFQRITSTDSEEIMPAKGDPLTLKEINVIRAWLKEGAAWPAFQVASFDLTPLTDDLAFLRRVTLDIVGVAPSEAAGTVHGLRMIARESVTNALKHAGATSVKIQLQTERGGLVMRVVDNGRGFDPTARIAGKRGHFGCAGVRGRSRKPGAAVVWRTALGAGTTVEVSLPLCDLVGAVSAPRRDREAVPAVI
ncbi:MAG: hypothetical protein H7343_06665 [Undibacterium sp.]|nr:hypothetical protein [Opitutaceae bacterium]